MTAGDLGVSFTEPVVVLIWPTRVETVFMGKAQVVSDVAPVIKGKLARARRAALPLREQGFRVTVFEVESGAKKRIHVEMRGGAGPAAIPRKQVRVFRTERETVEYLRGVAATCERLVGAR